MYMKMKGLQLAMKLFDGKILKGVWLFFWCTIITEFSWFIQRHCSIFIGFCFAASLTFQLCFAAKQKQFVLLLCSKLWTLLDQFVKWKDHACILHDLWTITRNEQNHSPIFHILCWWKELQSMNRAKLLNFMLWVENMGKYALIFRVSYSKTRVP